MEMSDPARQLASLCQSLSTGDTNQVGDSYLANAFGVDAWSAEFFEIVFAIIHQTTMIENFLISSMPDDPVAIAASTHLQTIRSAFARDAMANRWSQAGLARVGPQHSGPVQTLSFILREKFPVPILNEEEVVKLIGQVDSLLDWLKEAQIRENDFIRQSIIDGLITFRFRLIHLRWVGWGYSLESLEKVVTAYLVLELGHNSTDNPDVGALLAKTRVILKAVWAYVGKAKDFADDAEFIFALYGKIAAVSDVSKGVSGLLE